MTGPLPDVINRAKFYLNRVRGFDSVGGSNFWIPHKKEKSPLTQGLNYRSACDEAGYFSHHTVHNTGWAIKNVARYFCPYLRQLLVILKIFSPAHSADSSQ